MAGFVTFLHVLVCILLSIVILMQAGRGGGLTENFASAESMFGAKTNAFMVKSTSVLAVLFITLCLTLAFFSAKRDRSLMSDRPVPSAQKPSSSTEKEPLKTNTPAPVPDGSVQNQSNAQPAGGPAVKTKETGEDAHQDNSKIPETVPPAVDSAVPAAAK